MPESNQRIDRLFELLTEIHAATASTNASVAAMISTSERDRVALDNLSGRVSDMERSYWRVSGMFAAAAAAFPFVVRHIKDLFS